MDIEYLLWLQGLRNSAAPAIQAIFSFLGSDAAAIVMMLFPCVAFWCADKRRAMLAVMSYGLSSVSNQLIKNTVCCYRPWVRDPRVVPDAVAIKGATGYSFPSGHTQAAASALGGLGWAWRERRWPVVLGVIGALLIGFSRNFLGVHTPQDVLVGFVEGTIFVILCDRLLAWADEGEGRDARVVAAGLVAVVAFLAYVTLKPYPLDFEDGKLLVDPHDMTVDCYKAGGGLVGLLLGWYVERHWVKFETGHLGIFQGLARFAVGTVLVLTFYVPIGHALVSLLGDFSGQLLRNALTFFVAVAVVPLPFPFLDRHFAGGLRD